MEAPGVLEPIYMHFRTFVGIFRHGADVALMQGVLEHEAKGMGS